MTGADTGFREGVRGGHIFSDCCTFRGYSRTMVWRGGGGDSATGDSSLMLFQDYMNPQNLSLLFSMRITNRPAL